MAEPKLKCERAALVRAVATRLANNRGNARGVPDIHNVLDILPDNLVAQVMEDAESVVSLVLRYVAEPEALGDGR